MKLKYDADYRCRNCGVFTLKEQTNIHESIDCPKCRRTSDFVRGLVWRIEEPVTKKVHKTQKKLQAEIENE
jgi:phage FluMu protein Com